MRSRRSGCYQTRRLEEQQNAGGGDRRSTAPVGRRVRGPRRPRRFRDVHSRPAQAGRGRSHVPAAGLAELAETVHAPAVYIHIDLDVLDPAEFGSVGFPEPGGVTPDALLAAVRALSARSTVAGLGITEYQLGDPRDEEILASLVPALVKAVR
ncbi:arginase family protein [Streptosporangium pseudovulgare]|uniref:Arginase family protein n=1 Tax=Streptosporangium pseudovulgare TaxID=35765 RepID=A0ABQ2RB56_9ACTN|nr:hypothetical protein GCM10010140_57130 [Streptosporangium pseudovulgare]